MAAKVTRSEPAVNREGFEPGEPELMSATRFMRVSVPGLEETRDALKLNRFVIELPEDSVILLGKHGHDGDINLCFEGVRVRVRPAHRRAAQE